MTAAGQPKAVSQFGSIAAVPIRIRENTSGKCDLVVLRKDRRSIFGSTESQTAGVKLRPHLVCRLLCGINKMPGYSVCVVLQPFRSVGVGTPRKIRPAQPGKTGSQQ